ncbi:MAG: glycoside hydrolase family 1 protein [Candidatus Dormibacteraeota bacterium]|nr:glycoside hydrolase family 1 protein [Candidatus Dormibacteraeota bacterium]
MPEPSRQFPAGFFWATATAAHQVEGGNSNNDWWEWEQRPGRIADGSTSGAAVDHYHRFREDFAMLAGLKNNAHRLSIEWSRIEPTQGEFNPAEIAHYRDVLQSLRDNGLEPMLTLHHFSNPLWFSRRGGWAATGAYAAFLPFVRHVVMELGDLVRLWCTINEPNIYATQGWIFGHWPPGHRNDVVGLWRVFANLRLAHEAAYRVIKEAIPEAQVGLAHNKFWLVPARNGNPLDRVAVQTGRRMLDHWPARGGRLARVVAASSDFIGLNHYSGRLVRFDARRPASQFSFQFNPPGYPVSDFGDAIKPDWIRDALVELKPFAKPVYVTESGVAARDDEVRVAFLLDILASVREAIAHGVDLRGFFHWTSMDNFEWAHGYGMQFGLIGVDRTTMERSPKPSADLYTRIAGVNSLPN